MFAKTKPGKEGKKDSDKMKEIAKQEAYIYRSDSEYLTERLLQ